MSEKSSKHPRRRTLSYRALLIGIVSMVALAIWVHFHEVLAPKPGQLVENHPPTGAVGVFLGVLLIGWGVARIRHRLALSRGELLVIYTMLVLSAPLMTQGMWHRFLGLMVAIPHNEQYNDLADAYPDKLWPHGPHLIKDRTFSEGLGDHLSASDPNRVSIVQADESQIGPTTALQISHPPRAPGGEEPQTEVRLTVPRYEEGREVLVPGERYYLMALFDLDDMAGRSRLTVDVLSDGGERVAVKTLGRSTVDSFAHPGGFVRDGEKALIVPRSTRESLQIVFSLRGTGAVRITDVKFFSNEALMRLHKGSTEIAESKLDRLPENERDSLLVRPDDLGSPRGIWYALKGYIPYSQWVTPFLYWAVIVMAIFLCMLAIGVIFRRQWADNERFSFPLIVLPRLLLEQKDEDGRIIRPLFRKGAFRIGFVLAVVYAVLIGLSHYVPGLPSPKVEVVLSDLVNSPTLKAFVNGFGGTNIFQFSLLMVAIAFFVDLRLLASILVFLVLAHLQHAMGAWFGWSQTIRGPIDAFPFPHEQHIGAFLALALLVLWVSRKHLAGVFRTAVGMKGGVSDEGEAMSYRTSLLLIVACFFVFAGWGFATGLGAGSALLFFGFMVVCGLAAARIRTEFGAPAAYFTPYFPYLIFYMLGGIRTFGLETMVLVYFAGGFMAVAQFLMFSPSQVEMMQLGREQSASAKGVKWALILGGLGGLLLGGYVMLVWAYGVGGENIDYMRSWAIRQHWYFGSLGEALKEVDKASIAQASGQSVESTVQSKYGPPTAAGVGAGVTALLVFLRTRFAGFWLHPIGYILANTHFVYMTWGSILVAWAAKWVSLKVGGPRLIREHMTPLFAGVFCGAVGGVVVWDIVAVIAMSQGIRDVVVIMP